MKEGGLYAYSQEVVLLGPQAGQQQGVLGPLGPPGAGVGDGGVLRPVLHTRYADHPERTHAHTFMRL